MSGINVSAFTKQIQEVQAETKSEGERNEYAANMASKVFNGKESLSEEELFGRLDKLYGIKGTKNQWLKNTLFEGDSHHLKGSLSEWKKAGGDSAKTQQLSDTFNNNLATKEADGKILPQELNQAKNGNCACLAVLSMMAKDDHLREEVLEPSIVKQEDGSFRVYFAGADKELKGQEVKNDFGKDEKGFYATVTKADLNKYKNVVTADSDKDYLVLGVAAEKFAQTYGIRGDRSTLDGMYTTGLISLFTGKEDILAHANNSEALATYFENPGKGTIVFGGEGMPKNQLGKDKDQVIMGRHAYALVPRDNGKYELTNPWDTKNSMIVTEKQLREYLTQDGYINYIGN